MLKIALLFLAACGVSIAVHEAEVEFNVKGIRGTITFTELPEEDGIEPIRIEVDLSGLQGGHMWHVHVLPVDQTVDPSTQCLSSWVGPHYDPFGENDEMEGYKERCASNQTLCEAGDLAGKFGPIFPNGTKSAVDRTGTLFLDGPYSIIGRSLVIHSHLDASNFECGTIRSREEVEGVSATVLQATFVSPLAGTIYFKHVEGDTAYMWGKLFWTNDVPTTMEHDWRIHELIPSQAERLGMCNGIGSRYDPTDNRGGAGDTTYDDRCNPMNSSACEVGDLSGKHAQITVDANPLPYSRNAFFFTDNYLNLTGTNAVIDRSVAVYMQDSGMNIIACAPLVASEELTVSQYPDNYFMASQLSPFENTVITTTDGLPSTEVSVLGAALSPQTNCRTDDNAPTNDRTYVGFPPYSGPGEMTPDQYPLGDLQNRFSDELTTAGGSFEVTDMPVYGSDVTISNRALRVVDNGLRECSALLPLDLFADVAGGDVIMAKASFSSGELVGGIYFIQRDFGDGVLGNTFIIVNLYYLEEMMSNTSAHDWRVYEMVPQSQGQDCASEIGSRFNPFDVSIANTDDAENPSTNSDYRDDCSPLYPLRCESGDLSSKHGQIEISPSTQNRRTYSYVDNNVALTGTYSIVGHSIGIHQPASEGGTLFDCAEIEQTYPADIPLDVVFTQETITEVVEDLVSVSTVPPGCVLVLAQEVEDGSSAEASLRVFGDSETEANSNRDQLVGGAVHTTVPFSMFLLTATYLIASVVA